MSRYKLRKATDQDIGAINQLYNRTTGRNRTFEQYSWEWLQNPAGESERWVICEEITGEVVGHHGLIPIRFSAWDTSLLAGKTENTMVAPEHGNKFVYLSYEKRMIEEAKKRFDVFFTTAGGGAPGMIRKRLGYESMGRWTTYVLYASPRYVLNKLVERKRFGRVWPLLRLLLLPVVAAYGALRTLIGESAPGIRMIEASSFDEHKEELDLFWKKSKQHFGPTPERSPTYLEWRFKKNPYNTYRLFLFYVGHDLQGYAWIRSGEARAGDEVLSRWVIEDMVAAANDEGLYASFLKVLLKAAKGYHMLVFKTVISDDTLNRALRRGRFLRWREQTEGDPFYAYAHKPGQIGKGWFITEALSEGVITD